MTVKELKDFLNKYPDDMNVKSLYANGRELGNVTHETIVLYIDTAYIDP